MFVTLIENFVLRLPILWTVIILISSFSLNSMAFAQPKTTYAVETDPGTFMFNGYAAHFRVNPGSLKRSTFGIGIYSMEFPDIFVDLNSENKNKEWDVQLRQGIGLFFEYSFDVSNQGWLVGGQIASQNFRIKNADSGSNHVDFTNLLMMVHAGYRWFPFEKGMYVQPWMGIGYTAKVNGDNKLGTKKYDILPVLPFFTVHIGYRF